MQVAIWTVRYHSSSVFIEDSEEEAVRMVKALEDMGECAVMGVQFEDGRLISDDKFDEWESYKNYVEPIYDRPEPRPTREVEDPFRPGWTTSVEEDTPGWVGRQR